MLLRALLFTVIFAVSLNATAFNEATERESVDSQATTTETDQRKAANSKTADSKTVENVASAKDNAIDDATDDVNEDTKQKVDSRNGSASNSEQQKSTDLRSQKMQQCLSLIDKNVLQRFKDKGLKLNTEIKKLCHDKQRNQAQSQAVGFAVEIQRSKDMSVFRHCGKIIDQSSSTMGQTMKTYSASDLRYIHICDRHVP